MEDIKNMIY